MKPLTNCPACGSPRIDHAYVGRTGNARDFVVWRIDGCGECCHEFMNPQPSWEELEPYYSTDYDCYQTSSAAEGDDDEVVAKARKTGVFRHVPIKPGDRVLDVGCGGGYFLRVVNQLGAEAEGVEPSGFATDVARHTGLPIFQGSLEEYVARHSEKRFDVITSNHVLEHTPEPMTTLSAMRDLLAPNGFIWIAVPNAACAASRTLRDRWHSTDLPRHLMHFNPESLKRAAERAGLVVQSMSTYSLPKATAASIRTELRTRFAIPIRVSEKIGLIDTYFAPRRACRLDELGRGEAILANFARVQ